jgi:hypothetical protein
MEALKDAGLASGKTNDPAEWMLPEQYRDTSGICVREYLSRHGCGPGWARAFVAWEPPRPKRRSRMRLCPLTIAGTEQSQMARAAASSTTSTFKVNARQLLQQYSNSAFTVPPWTANTLRPN